MHSFKIRTISIIMSVLLLFTAAVPAASASNRSAGAVPIINIKGNGNCPILNARGESVDNRSLPDGYLTEAVKACMPTFIKALFSGEYDEYSKLLCSYISPFYENFALDKNGEASDGSGIRWGWEPGKLRDTQQNGVYGYQDYCFLYDSRLDLCASADILNDYINDVKRATGSDKVNVIARCEGVCLLNAYIAEYGDTSLSRIIILSTGSNGVEDVTSLFSGHFEVDAAAVERWANSQLTLSDPLLQELILTTIKLTKANYSLDLTAGVINKLYNNMFSAILPDLLLASYATMPAIWTMVRVDDFAEAKKFIFSGKEDEYAGLIEKIDNYYNTVSTRQNAFLSAAESHGVGVSVIAAYGYPIKPLYNNTNNEIGDGATRLRDLTFGATTAKIDSTLSAAYIQDRTDKGFAAYISPDRQVDLSTALFPETTWLIKGIEHSIFPVFYDEISLKIFRSETKLTADSDPTLPRFLSYNAEINNIEPLTEENAKPEKWETEDENVFEIFFRFIKLLYSYLSVLLKGTDA